jgi:hypothetical protein
MTRRVVRAGGIAPSADDHRWVAAALVEMGRGENRRAEHAARTGRHVLPGATRITVLEVYCSVCRVGYDSHLAHLPCSGVSPAARAG